VPQKEMRQHEAAHILRKHIPPNACGFYGVCGTPPTLVMKARGMQAGIQCGSGYGAAFYYQSAITGGKCSNAPMECPYPLGCSVLLWNYSMEDHWAIAQPDHPGPESINISQMSVSLYCRGCHDHCCCCLSLAQLFPG
jgi:hypothetical protein